MYSYMIVACALNFHTKESMNSVNLDPNLYIFSHVASCKVVVRFQVWHLSFRWDRAADTTGLIAWPCVYAIIYVNLSLWLEHKSSQA